MPLLLASNIKFGFLSSRPINNVEVKASGPAPGYVPGISRFRRTLVKQFQINTA